jgi:energy-coupling factor transporter ATP-binding protein EcfA2
MYNPNQITYFGETDFRGKKVRFGIKAEDRSRHVYIIGKTGMGKSTLLENMAAQDIKNGEGMCFIDPHGSAIDTLLDYIPEGRLNDVIYFAPFDSDNPISFNILETVAEDQKHLVVQGLMSTFDKIWPDTFSERMRYILSNTLLALLEYPGSTLLGVNRMYADKGYREEIVANVKDPTVKTFWVDEFAKWDERFMREATAAIQNKIGQFTANPIVRNIIGQKTSSFDFRETMDKTKNSPHKPFKGKNRRAKRRTFGWYAYHENLPSRDVACRLYKSRYGPASFFLSCSWTSSKTLRTNLSPIFCLKLENIN